METAMVQSPFVFIYFENFQVLLQVFIEKLPDFIKWNFFKIVIQISVTGSGNYKQFFVVAF